MQKSLANTCLYSWNCLNPTDICFTLGAKDRRARLPTENKSYPSLSFLIKLILFMGGWGGVGDFETLPLSHSALRMGFLVNEELENKWQEVVEA
jgi:hypothetical protein